MVVKITSTQSRILCALAQYKFLTPSQFIRLRIASRKQHLSSNNFKQLKSFKLIESADFAVTTRVDGKTRNKRVEAFYFLTNKGVQLLVEELHMQQDSIKYPKGTAKLFTDKYYHRFHAINTEICANLWAKDNDYEIVLFDRDFDKIGNNRTGSNLQAKTKVLTGRGHHIIPDANFIIQKGEDVALFTFEMHNTRPTKDIIKQLIYHTYAVENGSLGLRYDYQKAHRVLNVFVEEGKRDSVLKRIRNTREFYEMERFFFFKTVDEIGEDFFDGWQNLSGERVSLF